MFHPEYYHWVRRTSVAYDSHYFNEVVGKSYTKGFSQFPIRVEIHPDAPNYAQGWMAYGDGLKAEINKIDRAQRDSQRGVSSLPYRA